MCPIHGRERPPSAGGGLELRWFAAVLARLNIAKNGHSTGLAAIGREGEGWGRGNGAQPVGQGLAGGGGLLGAAARRVAEVAVEVPRGVVTPT